MRPMTHATYGDYEGPTMAPRLWGAGQDAFFPYLQGRDGAGAAEKRRSWPLDT